jgi:hypothetical protein
MADFLAGLDKHWMALLVIFAAIWFLVQCKIPTGDPISKKPRKDLRRTIVAALWARRRSRP